VSVTVLGIGAWMLFRLGNLPWLRIDWSDPSAWLARAEADQALAAVARLTGLALAGWVGVTSLVYLIARLAGVRPASISWLSIGPIRRAVDALLAGSLLLGTVAPSLPAGAGLAEDTTTSPPVEIVLPEYIPFPAGEVYPLPADGEPTTTAPTESLGDLPTPIATRPPATSPEPQPHGESATVVVESGDNLWTLAARHLEHSGHRAESAEEIAPYWMMVVEANRDRIRSGDPDLIYPGEEILLPRISPES
jgi:nucleoid-associated protein YgaU